MKNIADYYEPTIECASRDLLSAIQSAALKRIVKLNYDNVPTMRKRLQDAGIEPGDIQSIEDIVKLPFTYKTDLRDNYPFGMFAVPPRDLVRIHASSGTTGKQTVVGYTDEDVHNWARATARCLVAAGANADDLIHIIEIVKLIAVNSDGWHSHSAGHNRHFPALIGTGIAKYVTNRIKAYRVFQICFCDKFCTQRVSRH